MLMLALCREVKPPSSGRRWNKFSAMLLMLEYRDVPFSFPRLLDALSFTVDVYASFMQPAWKKGTIAPNTFFGQILHSDFLLLWEPIVRIKSKQLNALLSMMTTTTSTGKRTTLQCRRKQHNQLWFSLYFIYHPSICMQFLMKCYSLAIGS